MQAVMGVGNTNAYADRATFSIHLERIRALYARAAGPAESAAGVRTSFAVVSGVSFDELEAAWLAFIGS